MTTKGDYSKTRDIAEVCARALTGQPLPSLLPVK